MVKAASLRAAAGGIFLALVFFVTAQQPAIAADNMELLTQRIEALENGMPRVPLTPP